MSEARSIKLAKNVGELIEQDSLEVVVFLVCADYVGGRGERIVVIRWWDGKSLRAKRSRHDRRRHLDWR